MKISVDLNVFEELTHDSKPLCGNMTAQHMIEHLEYTYRIASGEIQDFEVATPEKILEKVHNSLYNYKPFPKGSDFPLLKKGELADLQRENLADAISTFKATRQNYLDHFTENPDAVFAVNDPVAIGALFQIRKAGLNIHEDIALVGFSDNPIAALIEPPLTTVAQPRYEIGKFSAKILIDQINNKSVDSAPIEKVLKTKLIIRQST